MDLPFPILIKYLLTLFVEIFTFSLFAYFVFSITKAEINRRCKGSVIIGVVSGLCFHTLFLILIIISWLNHLNPVTFFNIYRTYMSEVISGILGMDSMILMPITIISTIIAYVQLEQTGDRLIEKYWRNPKIYYGENPKPPYLKF
jgi:hypothetical protein